MDIEDKKIIIGMPLVIITEFAFLYWMSTISPWALGISIVVIFFAAMIAGMADGDDSVE